jgi:hypothetical protein
LYQLKIKIKNASIYWRTNKKMKIPIGRGGSNPNEQTPKRGRPVKTKKAPFWLARHSTTPELSQGFCISKQTVLLYAFQSRFCHHNVCYRDLNYRATNLYNLSLQYLFIISIIENNYYFLYSPAVSI